MKKVVFFIGMTLTCATLSAQENKLPHQLLVGDNMPALAVDKWMKGGPVDVSVKGRVYLIDFWAAWCGPCVAGMSHLSELSKKYKEDGLVVIGATSEDKWGNSYEQASKFLNDSKMAYDYNFAWLAESYRKDHKYKAIIYDPLFMAAYDSTAWALPQVFLVDRHGKIAFLGDGYSLKEDYLKLVLADKHDIRSERTNYIEQCRVELSLLAFFKKVEDRKYDDAFAMGNAILRNPNLSAHSTLYVTEMLFKNKDIESNLKMTDLGLQAAKRGVVLTDGQSPSHLSALARAYALKKDKKMAVATAQKAMDLAQGDFREAIRKDMETYSNL